jgi:hypothetical protein
MQTILHILWEWKRPSRGSFETSGSLLAWRSSGTKMWHTDVAVALDRGGWRNINRNGLPPKICPSSLADNSLWIRCWCHPFGISLPFELVWRKSWGELRLCYIFTSSRGMKTLQEHGCIGTTVWCWRKPKVLALLPQRTQCKHSWVSGSLKHFSLPNWICKSCQGTPLSNSNLLIMVHGALLDYGRLLSGNKLLQIWEKHWMLLMRMFLKFLTMFGVSKVLLVFLAI